MVSDNASKVTTGAATGTPSIPAGLYVYCGHAIRRGEIIAFPLPASAFDYARRRGEPTDLLLLKHVLAVGGDFVSTIDSELRVNGTLVRRFPAVDSVGRSLPQWHCAGVLHDGLWVGSSSDRSFDSRFLGAIYTAQIRGVYWHLGLHSPMHEPIAGRSIRRPCSACSATVRLNHIRSNHSETERRDQRINSAR